MTGAVGAVGGSDMAASVRLEDETFGCMKYERLAEYAGLADSDHARGKMAKLWRQCTLEQVYVLSESDVVRVLGDNGVRAICDAKLGEIVDGGVRIKGTKGRIEWLKKLRANGKKGGRPRKPKGLASGSPDSDSAKPDSNPPSPSPSPSPVQEEKRSARSEPEEAIWLADKLAELIRERQPKNKLVAEARWEKTRSSWAREFRLASEQDGRSWEELRQVLNWSQGHKFWKANILCASTLREKFDVLQAQMQRPDDPPRFGRGAQPEPPLYAVEE